VADLLGTVLVRLKADTTAGPPEGGRYNGSPRWSA